MNGTATDWLGHLRDLQQMPVAQFGRVLRHLRQRLDARLEPYGITGVQFGLLALVAEEEGITQTRLQQQLAIEGATLTQLLQRLEREGWVVRTCDRADRRRQRVWLTERSRELLPRIAEEVERHRREMQRGFTAEELALLGEMLRRIEENAQR